MILLDISTLSAALQIGAAIALVILTGWTLVVLRKYAADTKRIAEASVSQTENSLRPFLTVAYIERATAQDVAFWVIANQGFGPALSVRFKLYPDEGSDKWRSIADIEKGQIRKNFNEEIWEHIQNSSVAKMRPFVIEYSSLAGIRYRTIVERMPDRELRTTVDRLS